MNKHIMLAFVSTVNPNNIKNPIVYNDIQGAEYSAIQTNESAIVYVERKLQKDSNSLSKIFLIVSDAVKNDFVPAETEFGTVTHLDFLKKRLVKVYPELKDKFKEKDYSESTDDLENNILQITVIADAITNFAAEYPNEKIIVHADMTGGFRHVSMLMLSIIQLLKYRGIEIGEILYSDNNKKIVYCANEIQKVSTLITGADEFVKFGSVEALQEYFNGNTNKTTTDLLDAMKRFSEAIKICHTSAIKEELKNLGTHIKNFRNAENKDIQSELFAKIIDRVESEYGNLIEGNAGNIDIIRWCVKKGFWQQAMTLCTEWLPQEIIERKIFAPKDKIFIEHAKIEGQTQGRGWQQHFIVSYNCKDKSRVEDELLKVFLKDLRFILQNYPSSFDESLMKESYKHLKKLLEQYSQGDNDFSDCINGKLSVKDFYQKYNFLSPALSSLRKEQSSTISFANFLKKLKYNNILKQIAGLKSETLLKIFGIDKSKALKAVMEEMDVIPKDSWENREAIYLKLLDDGVAISDLENKKAFELLHGYYEIRRERNLLNHANSDDKTDSKRRDIPSIGKMIVNYLDEIEKIK